MGTVRALAHGDILKAEKILLQPYATVFLWLRMEHTEGKFRKNYAEVLKRKTKVR